MISDILTAREQKLFEVKKHLSNNHVTLLIKANIPGQNKNTSEAYFLVNLFSLQIQKSFQVVQFISKDGMDGPYDIITIKGISAIDFKYKSVEIENIHPLGRFIDLDVFANKPVSISRDTLNLEPRKCYICQKDAHRCSREKRHSIGILLKHIENAVRDYLKTEIKKAIKHSMIKELDLEDKFGLVTKSSSGSHHDMDYELMLKSQDAIIPYLTEIFMLGYHSNDLETLLEKSRPLGIKAEEKMLEVTQGVNTYKGLIFILGLSLLSTGYAIKNHQPYNEIYTNVSKMTHSIYKDFDKKGQTSGLKAYETYKLSGIRGEVFCGLPSVVSAIKLLTNERDETLREVLKHLIIVSEDTVFLNRASTLENYHSIKQLFKKTDLTNTENLKKLNQKMIEQNISFGGSADLLIVTIFLNTIKLKFFK